MPAPGPFFYVHFLLELPLHDYLLTTSLDPVYYITMSDSEEYVDFQLYRYEPSVAAAVIFVVLFVLTTLWHLYQLIKSRSWYFIAFVLGGICEFFSTPESTFSMTGLEQSVLTMMTS